MSMYCQECIFFGSSEVSLRKEHGACRRHPPRELSVDSSDGFDASEWPKVGIMDLVW